MIEKFYNYFIISIGYFLLIILLAVFGFPEIVNFASLVVLVLMFFIDKKVLYVIFIASLPISSFLSSDYNFLFVFNHEINISLLTILAAIWDRSVNYPAKINKVIFSFLLTLLIINLYMNFKNGYLEIYDMDLSKFSKSSIKLILKTVAILLLVHKNLISYSKILPAVMTMTLVLVFTSATTEFLILKGLDIKQAEIENMFKYEVSRFAGVFNGGDVNSLGAFYVINIGFLLGSLKFLKSIRIISMIIILLSFIGIIWTASRTAYLSLAIILFLYFIFNGLNRNSFTIIFLILAGIIVVITLFKEQFAITLQRFSTVQNETELDTDNSRVGKWIMYLDYIFSDFSTLFYGNSSEFWLRRRPHNLFIFFLFNTGIFFTSYYIIQMFKLIRKSISYELLSLLMIFPFFAISMYVSEQGGFVLVPILLKALVDLPYTAELKYE